MSGGDEDSYSSTPANSSEIDMTAIGRGLEEIKIEPSQCRGSQIARGELHRGQYTVTGRGTNTQGNRWDTREYETSSGSKSSYHYSNLDGSYYYRNPDGSSYFDNGTGGARYTRPDGSGWEKRPFFNDGGHTIASRTSYAQSTSSPEAMSTPPSTTHTMSEAGTERSGVPFGENDNQNALDPDWSDAGSRFTDDGSSSSYRESSVRDNESYSHEHQDEADFEYGDDAYGDAYDDSYEESYLDGDY